MNVFLYNNRSQCYRSDHLQDNCVYYLVVDVTVGEHGVEVLDALAGAAVEVVLQPLLDRPHVHRLLDDLMVVLGEGGREGGRVRGGEKRWKENGRAQAIYRGECGVRGRRGRERTWKHPENSPRVGWLLLSLLQ